MSSDNKTKLGKDDIDGFFKTINIDVEGIVKNKNNPSNSCNLGNNPYDKRIKDTQSSCSGDCGCGSKDLPKNEKGPNILYLTTDCNLACEYCYEKNERDSLKEQRVMSLDEISEALKKIHKKWSDNRSSPETVVIFGGEPLLEPNSLKHILDKSLELGKDAFAFCLTSNGLWFLKEENVVKYKDWVKNRTISLEISWDGSGNFRRIFKNGSSAEKSINEALDNLAKHNVPVTLRYTVHSGNYNKVINDYVYALEKWKNVKKIQNSYDYNGLDFIEDNLPCDKLIYDKYNYRDYFRALWNIYGVPLCQEVCDLCNYCDRSMTAVNYFVPKEDVLVQNINEKGQLQSKPFDHWLREK